LTNRVLISIVSIWACGKTRAAKENRRWRTSYTLVGTRTRTWWTRWIAIFYKLFVICMVDHRHFSFIKQVIIRGYFHTVQKLYLGTFFGDNQNYMCYLMGLKWSLFYN